MPAATIVSAPHQRLTVDRLTGNEGPFVTGKDIAPSAWGRRSAYDSLDVVEPSDRSSPRVDEFNQEDTAGGSPATRFNYIYACDFDQPDAADRFLAPLARDSGAASIRPKAVASLSPYIVDLYRSSTLLRREQETHLFLKMNYLKYRASQLQAGLGLSRARQSDLAEIEWLRKEALRVKARLVESGLRLVVSIAKKLKTPELSFTELLSEGNLALVLAVETFDVSRGFRFSTYATCAVRRKLARAKFRERRQRVRFVSVNPQMLEERCGAERQEDAFLHCDEVVVRQMVDRLNGRERDVIVSRFGLDGGPRKTLAQLGKELKLTKEGVRRIELRARKQLRELASEHCLERIAV